MVRLGTRTPGGRTYDLHQGDLTSTSGRSASGAKLLAASALGCAVPGRQPAHNGWVNRRSGPQTPACETGYSRPAVASSGGLLLEGGAGTSVRAGPAPKQETRRRNPLRPVMKMVALAAASALALSACGGSSSDSADGSASGSASGSACAPARQGAQGRYGVRRRRPW